jgi:hypothetical protein
MPTDFDDEPSDVDSIKQPDEPSIKSELTVEHSSFSVPVENSVAIITIPSINDIEEPPLKVEPSKMEEKISAEIDVPVKKVEIDIPAKSEETAVPDISVQPTKKRRGRQPLAASTAKKTKLSPSKSSIKEESNNRPHRFNLRSSSRESSVESNKGDASITKTVTLPAPKRRSSSHENLLKSAVEKDVETKTKNNKKVTRVQELKGNKKESAVLKRSATSSESSLSSSSDGEHEKRGRGRPRKAKIQNESSQKITNFFKKEPVIINETIEDTSKIIVNDKSVKIAENTEKMSNENSSSNEEKFATKINGRRQSTARLKRKVLYDSDSDSECAPLVNYNKQCELKSVMSSDFNPQIQSSIIERYDYLNKPSPSFADKPKNENNVISSHPICADLKDIVDKSKEMDPTYLKPPENAKRPYLKTSAFKGNHINSDDSSNHTDSSTKQLSVSCDDSSIINNTNDGDIKENGLQNASSKGIKDRMKELIKKQKEKINSVPKTNEIPVNTDSNSSKPIKEQISDKIKKKKPEPRMSSYRPRRKVDVDDSNKKIFEQEVVEKPIEKLVCYDEILEAIRITDPPRKNGRASSAIKPLELAKKQEYEKQLKNLEHFKCGNCNKLVTKHKWKDHLIDHGGMAWIETFESPIDIKDWNESVRRLNNYMRIYKLENFRCPNCGCDKRSALGHLSHIYICGESEETIEDRKATCELCEERVLPYNMSWHKRKCTVINKKENEKINADDGDDEEEENDESNSRSSSVKDGGRVKRKAGKK